MTTNTIRQNAPVRRKALRKKKDPVFLIAPALLFGDAGAVIRHRKPHISGVRAGGHGSFVTDI